MGRLRAVSCWPTSTNPFRTWVYLYQLPVQVLKEARWGFAECYYSVTMPTLRTQPVTDVKRRATEIIARLQKERVPVLITEHGRAAAVLLDVASYDELLRRLELLEGIARGERAFSEGRVTSHKSAKKRMRRWLSSR